MKKPRSLPPRLRALRERDPNAFIAACKRGGQTAAANRKSRKNIMTKTEESQLAEIATWEQHEAARLAAWQRQDHLLPREDQTDL